MLTGTDAVEKALEVPDCQREMNSAIENLEPLAWQTQILFIYVYHGKIRAIKHARTQLGLGLKIAKDLVDDVMLTKIKEVPYWLRKEIVQYEERKARGY